MKIGIGDELLASGQARKLHKEKGQPVAIVGIDGRLRRHELWEGVPYIVKDNASRPVTRLLNGPGARPYTAAKDPLKWAWRPFVPTPAEIVFTKAELAFAEPFRGRVMIEPNVKVQKTGQTNKAWVPERWTDVALHFAESGVPLVQCGPMIGTNWLYFAMMAHTETFRQACAVLSVARAFVGTEGGLHHAAAAVGTPSVVLWSEFISPEITGYTTQTNIRHAGKPCGSRYACEGCRASMEAITVKEVTDAVERLLQQT